MDATIKPNLRALLPVLFSFFVMGFIDIVGTATSNIKADLNLNNTLAGLLPNFILIWFLVLSVPFGILTNRIGRKTPYRSATSSQWRRCSFPCRCFWG